MNDYVIGEDKDTYKRVVLTRNYDIACACLAGLKSNGYTAILFSDKIKKETVYRVIVKK